VNSTSNATILWRIPQEVLRLSRKRSPVRYAYFITCQEAIKNDQGEIVELRCTYDRLHEAAIPPDGRKVKGTIHGVSARHAISAEVRLYEYLFTKEIRWICPKARIENQSEIPIPDRLNPCYWNLH
jgi:hypothetical protein